MGGIKETAPSFPPLPPGSGRRPRLDAFIVDDPLGSGGMGVVWRGKHAQYDLPVALKILSAELTESPELVSSFHRELQAIAALDHPGVVVVVAHGVVSAKAEQDSGGALREGSPYFAMELASGTLEEAISRVELTWEQVRSYLLSVLDALAHAHARGFVHRDLKPANILRFGWFDDPRLKLTDFGIAHSLDSGGDIHESQIIGTPAYMAPEQIRGHARDLGPWTDLYALGCIAYQLTSGRVPFRGRSPIDVAELHLREPVPPLEARMPVPVGFDSWLRSMMAKRPKNRFQRAADAAWSLMTLGEPRGSGRAKPRAQTTGELPTLSVLFQSEELFDTTARETADADLRAEMASVKHSPAGRLSVPLVLPRSWRTQSSPPRSNELVAASLSLFGLRPPPLLGRERQLDQLWQTLLDVHERDTPAAVVIRGPAGIGKSHLARSFGERADELGAASVLYATHDSGERRGAGLVRMLSLYLRYTGLTTAEGVERRTRRVRQIYDLPVTGPLSRLSALILGDAAESPVAVAEEAAIYTKFFELLGRERPVLVVCDDSQWGEAALALTQHLLGQVEAELPVMVVHTVNDEAAAPAAIARLSGLLEHPRCSTIDLGPLDSSTHAALIDSLISLELGTRAKVMELSDGHPLFAIQIIDSWVSTGALVLGDRGFSLRGDVPPVIGVSANLERMVSGLPDDDLHAIELAAVLGIEVASEEWAEACARAGCQPSDDLVRRLVGARLATWTALGWRFSHRLVRESLSGLGSALGRRVRFHRICAELLRERPSGSERDARIGRHLFHAREYERAIPFLTSGAAGALEADSYVTADELLQMRERSLRHLGAMADDRRVTEGWLLRTRLHSAMGRLDKAGMLAARTVAKVEVLGHHDLAAEAFLALARAQEIGGRLRDAENSYRQAQAMAEIHGDREATARACLGIASVAIQLGTPDRAARWVERALALDAGPVIHSLARTAQADIALLRGERGFASNHLVEALALARELGLDGACHANYWRLGDIYRERGHFERAEDYYRRCEEYYAATGSPQTSVILLKRSYLELARGQWARAEGLARRAERDSQRLRHRRYVSSANIAMATAAAGSGDWIRFDHALAGVNTSLNLGLDDIWALRMAATQAERAGEQVRGRRALLAARNLASRLERHDLVAEIDRDLTAPSRRGPG